ncbi:MAG: O-methyltransferase [Halioglobus sp.]|jgi:O-methyltransferase
MHNNFISELMDWRPTLPGAARLFNRCLARFGTHMRIVHPWGNGRMSNVEQRMNHFHLCSQVLAYNVPGDFVDLGCYLGQTSVIFDRAIQEYDPQRLLHVYDAFLVPGSVETLKHNFFSVGATVPEIHAGWIQETIPEKLPERISFAHIDLGSRINPEHKELVIYCLEHIYPRMSEGAICVLQSYCDPSIRENWDPFHRPAVKQAADEFFKNRPEEMSVLYTGEAHIFAHGYFRKKAQT